MQDDASGYVPDLRNFPGTSSLKKSQELADLGWCLFDHDPKLVDWALAALPSARLAIRDPALAHQFQCEGTWFVGLDALPNDTEGRIRGSGPLQGHVVDVLRSAGVWSDLHPGQISVTYPGYPKPRDGETPAAFRYRLRRDAAHIDGIIATGPERRRFISEPHAWILGIPLSEADANAAPLVVWSGSPAIIRHGLLEALSPYPPTQWESIDVTDAYQSARRQVFETCPRIELPLRPGQAVLLHRLALHGVAPWQQGAKASADGRMIAYFRPPMPGGVSAWLDPN